MICVLFDTCRVMLCVLSYTCRVVRVVDCVCCVSSNVLCNVVYALYIV